MYAYMLSNSTQRSDEDWMRGLGIIKVYNSRYDHVGGGRFSETSPNCFFFRYKIAKY